MGYSTGVFIWGAAGSLEKSLTINIVAEVWAMYKGCAYNASEQQSHTH